MSQPQLLSLPVVNEIPTHHRLCLHVNGMARMIDTQNIAYLQSEVNYTRIFLKDGKAYLEAKTLKHFSGVLEGPEFIRIHKSYLVNRSQIVSITPDYVLLRNGLELSISRRKRRVLKKNRTLVKSWTISTNTATITI
ncbi:LytTR family DNA-binding domain-containing protein [Runella sp.]|jgi:two-component system LytT family response regulator|uniref:LytR/AlgR family response regulator transcription factor n=1 Tax=Runella sp. TaxID=1960881 RepID=UPI003018D6D5